MERVPYEILEHTADIGLMIYGRTLPEIFVHSALGLVALAVEAEPAIKEIPLNHLPLSVRGSDLEQLLVNWLSEILYFMDADGWRFSEFRVSLFEGDKLEGEGLGYRRPIAQRTRAIAVKAVTYHQISVREVADGWEAVVYFDI